MKHDANVIDSAHIYVVPFLSSSLRTLQQYMHMGTTMCACGCSVMSGIRSNSIQAKFVVCISVVYTRYLAKVRIFAEARVVCHVHPSIVYYRTGGTLLVVGVWIVGYRFCSPCA